MIAFDELAERPSYISHLLGAKTDSKAEREEEGGMVAELYRNARATEQRALGGTVSPPDHGGTKGANLAAH